ncbi:MAG: SPOR domain-containing protein [candidate division WOR-3 bacterium]|jgi:tetratricopeptide (TPR) repeat protein
MIFTVLLLLLNAESTIKEKYNKALKIKDPLEAVEYYRQIVKEAPNTPYADSSLFRIGMLYYILGDFNKTINHFEIIYKKGEKSTLYSKTCYWLKFCYENIGDSTKAKELIKKNKNLFSDEIDKKEVKEQTAIETKPPLQKTEVQTKQEEYHTVQLGAYQDKKWLEYFISKLKENDVEYFIKQAGDYSKIFSGKFDTRREAEEYLEEIKSKGFHGFITLDSNP